MIVKTIGQLASTHPLHSIAPDASLREAAQMMERANVGALPVVEGEHLRGILSERDIVRRAVAQGLPPQKTPVSAAMTADPVTVQAGDPVSDALAVKLGDAFRHLPVMEAGRVVGVISYRDIPAEYLMLFERFREMAAAHADEAP